MKMKVSALIIGMIAGTFGLSEGAELGEIYKIRGPLVTVTAVAGMVGAAFSISKQRTASTLMIVAGIVGAIASSTFWFSTILFGIAALLAFLPRKANKATHK